ncbi:MAG: hypothetical protein ACAH59_04755, partial [Pseudobdellovibrionaceae bacterium]
MKILLCALGILLFSTCLWAQDLQVQWPQKKQNLKVNQTASLVVQEHKEPFGEVLHIFNPETGQELRTLPLKLSPLVMLRDRNCQKIYYNVGTSFFELEWKLKSEPLEIFKFPENVVPAQRGQELSGKQDIADLHSLWKQAKAKTWRLGSIKTHPESATDYTMSAYEFNPDQKSWKLLSEKKTKGCYTDGGGCSLKEFNKDIY